jgi:hypothetical protein
LCQALLNNEAALESIFGCLKARHGFQHTSLALFSFTSKLICLKPRFACHNSLGLGTPALQFSDVRLMPGRE